MEVVLLRTLVVGDRFIAASSKGKKNPIRYKVLSDKCEFNAAAGTATKLCMNESTQCYETKQCILKVIKLNNEKRASINI